jgi:Ring finger domain
MLALQLQWDLDNETARIESVAWEQHKYEIEDRRLADEREALAVAFPKPFKCGICLDDHPEDSVARVAQCEHPFCRTCLRDYVRSKLKEHIFPIFCPICVAEQGTSPTCAFSFAIRHVTCVLISLTAAVNEDVVRQLGFTEEEYSIFDELQISAYSILLHCRRRVSSEHIPYN